MSQKVNIQENESEDGDNQKEFSPDSYKYSSSDMQTTQKAKGMNYIDAKDAIHPTGGLNLTPLVGSDCKDSLEKDNNEGYDSNQKSLINDIDIQGMN